MKWKDHKGLNNRYLMGVSVTLILTLNLLKKSLLLSHRCVHHKVMAIRLDVGNPNTAWEKMKVSKIHTYCMTAIYILYYSV